MSELVKKYTEEEAKAFFPGTVHPVGGVVQETQGSRQIGATYFVAGNTLFRFGCVQEDSRTCPALEGGSHVCAARRADGSQLPPQQNIICGRLYPDVEIISAQELVKSVANLPQ